MRINSEIHTLFWFRSPTTYGSSCWYCRRRSCARAVGNNARRRRRRRVYAAAAASAIPIKYRFGLRRRLRDRRAAVSVLLQRGIRGSGGDMQRHRRCLRRGGIDSRARSSRSGGGSSSRGGRRARGRRRGGRRARPRPPALTTRPVPSAHATRRLDISRGAQHIGAVPSRALSPAPAPAFSCSRDPKLPGGRHIGVGRVTRKLSPSPHTV